MKEARKWMNPRARPRESYKPTSSEQIVNIVTHGLCIIPSVFAMLALLSQADSDEKTIAGLIYGGGLIVLFVTSTVFHCSVFFDSSGRFRCFIHRCDRAVIFIFIATTFYPWMSLIRFKDIHEEVYFYTVKCAIGVSSIAGIICQQIIHNQYKTTETVCYMILASGATFLLVYKKRFLGFEEFMGGGVLYLIGLIFFKMDGIIPCAHGIWHVFVIVAASLHYYAVFNYLYLTKVE